MDEIVTVFRFKWSVAERECSPKDTWATLTAIARLHGCDPIPGSSRRVEARRLEAGMLFEDYHPDQ
jgi:hypothetical protein